MINASVPPPEFVCRQTVAECQPLDLRQPVEAGADSLDGPVTVAAELVFILV